MTKVEVAKWDELEPLVPTYADIQLLTAQLHKVLTGLA